MKKISFARFRFAFIGFIFLLTMPLLGCGLIYYVNIVPRLDAVILTADDVPTMELNGAHRIGGVFKDPPTVAGFDQWWDGIQPEEHIAVKYWLFQTNDDAQKAAAEWRSGIAAAAIKINGKIESAYQPEPNPEHVIGDATWRVSKTRRGRSGNSIWFVKNNVLVYVMGRRPSINQLPLTRAVARKIEVKIEAVLNKK